MHGENLKLMSSFFIILEFRRSYCRI